MVAARLAPPLADTSQDVQQDVQQSRQDPDLPVPGAVGDDEGLTALTLLQEAKRELEQQKHLLDEAEVRERVVLGEQWRARDPMQERIMADVHVVDGVIQENRLYPLVNTYSSRIDQGRVAARGWPVHATLDDALAAEAADFVLDYERRRCDEDSLIYEAANLAQYHGDVLFYPYWNDTEEAGVTRVQQVDDIGPVFDDYGNPVYVEEDGQGAIAEDVVSAMDYWTDCVDKYDRCSLLVVRRVIHPSVARARLDAAGLFDVTVSETSESSRSTSQIVRKGVECFEMWHKPGARFRDGNFSLIVGGCVTKSIPFPYLDRGGRPWRELPGAVWKIGHVRGSPRGKTHVSDAIHQQRLVNATLRAILRRLDVCGQAAMVGNSGHLQQLRRPGRSQLESDNPKDQDPRWVVGPEVPQSLFTQYNLAIAALNAVFGVAEATATGGDPGQSESGRQLDIAQQLDAQKLSPARRSLEAARLRVDRQKIMLARQYWDAERLVSVLGPDGAISARFLSGADLDGADVALEATSGVLETHAARGKEAEEEYAAGLASPGDAAERRRTGLTDTIKDSEQAQRVDAQAIAALRGKPQQPLPDVDPDFAVDRLQARLRSPAAQQGDQQNLLMLLASYTSLAQAKGQPMPGGPPQGGPQGGGGGRPGVTPTAAMAAGPQASQPGASLTPPGRR